LASGLTVFSQNWSEPVILTDTVSYNSNPEMFVFDNGYGTAYLFFEKKWDENSKTEIWTNNNRRDYNPDFFIDERNGEFAEHTEIWQSEINGKSALCMSYKMDYFVGIDEQEKTGSSIAVYPNPFSGQLTIKCNLSGTLEIFDIKGEKVFTKNLTTKGTGEQTTIWVPESIPEGLYFINIISGEYQETRKVLYTK